MKWCQKMAEELPRDRTGDIMNPHLTKKEVVEIRVQQTSKRGNISIEEGMVECVQNFERVCVCVCGLQPRNQRKWYHPGACLEPHWGGDRVTSHCCRWKPGCRAPPWILMTALMSIHLLSAHCSVVVWSFYYEVQRLLNLPLLDSFFSHILNNIVPVQRSVQLKVKCSQHLMFSLTTGTITTSWTSSPSLQINKSNLMFCSSASWFERFQSFITVSTPALKARSKESWVRCPEDPHITNAASCG